MNPDFGCSKPCSDCYGECMRTGSWPTYKMSAMNIKIRIGKEVFVPEGDGIAFTVFCSKEGAIASLSATVMDANGDAHVSTWIEERHLNLDESIEIQCVDGALATPPINKVVHKSVDRVTAEKKYVAAKISEWKDDEPQGK